MVRKMYLERTIRKVLGAAIAEITGEKAICRKLSTCSYDGGVYFVTIGRLMKLKRTSTVC